MLEKPLYWCYTITFSGDICGIKEMIQHSNFGVISRLWLFSTLSLVGILALM
ncbi:hypothetical protein O9992_14470 [Vibrio lentus]|nr:hypothetical protein [Vibrio lentus]